MKRSVLVGFGALTILALLMAPLCALAAEWDMYGSARVDFFYNTYDKEVGVDNYYTGHTGNDQDSDTDLTMGLQPNSRIGANVKASDAVSGRFEYGTGVNVRLLYGDWNFGSGTLRVGQDYTPISGATSNQVVDWDDNLNSVGAVDGSRLAQLKLIMGGLQVALIKNEGSAGNFTGYSTDILIPKIEASYEFTTDMLSIMPFVGYQTLDVESASTSETITSYLVGVHGRVTLGPAYINFSGHYAQNAGDYGLFPRGADVVPAAGAPSVSQSVAAISYARLNSSNGNLEDASGYGCALVLGFKATEALLLEAGIGYIKSEVDAASGTTLKDDTVSYYVNAVVTLANGVYIVPEIGIFDYGDFENGSTTIKEGKRLYYGAKFQIDF
jgi:hypothetical protein